MGNDRKRSEDEHWNKRSGSPRISREEIRTWDICFAGSRAPYYETRPRLVNPKTTDFRRAPRSSGELRRPTADQERRVAL